MNIKVIFYNEEVCHDSILKNIFEAIIDEENTDLWLDNNISSVFNTFEFSLVLDWQIISSEETEEALKEPEIIGISKGRIVYSDDTEILLLKTIKENYELLKQLAISKGLDPLTLNPINVVKPPTRKRDYPSCWINLLGETTIVGFSCHEEWATEYLKEHNPELFDKYGIKNERKYSHEILEDMGWIRILGWYDPPAFVMPISITSKQKVALREYCIKNKLKYQDFPEILKS